VAGDVADAVQIGCQSQSGAHLGGESVDGLQAVVETFRQGGRVLGRFQVEVEARRQLVHGVGRWSRQSGSSGEPPVPPTRGRAVFAAGLRRQVALGLQDGVDLDEVLHAAVGRSSHSSM
jgi:hypothetical protein